MVVYPPSLAMRCRQFWPATNPANAGIREEFRLNTAEFRRHTVMTLAK